MESVLIDADLKTREFFWRELTRVLKNFPKNSISIENHYKCTVINVYMPKMSQEHSQENQLNN
jgi:hypothetical protein